MTSQDDRQALPKRSQKKGKIGKQQILQPSAIENKEVWKAYWKDQGQTWRLEPEIDVERQKFLAEKRSITADIENGVYPFKDIEPKLIRADIEWLLATHDNGSGPVTLDEVGQRRHRGLDLRGADLSHLDLHNLPLSYLLGGLTWNEWKNASKEQRTMSAVLLQGTDLSRTHLEEAVLTGSQLSGADLSWAFLEKADLYGANLEDTILKYAQLKGAVLRRGHLKRANLFRAHLEGANLSLANLAGADLRSAFFDSEATLRDVIPNDEVSGFMTVADVRWAGVNLALIKWPHRKWIKELELGDEHEAHKPKTREGKIKDRPMRIVEYEAAVRANHQLSVELDNQGLKELSDHFAFRAQVLQRVILPKQNRLLKYSFSWLLDLIAGYGYRPIRTLLWYLFIVLGFAFAYYLFGHIASYPDALVFSLISFHGRGFFPTIGDPKHILSLHDPIVRLAAVEAVVGLFIEISFIATFTQRYIGK